MKHGKCPKCGNVQDFNLQFCQKCSEEMGDEEIQIKDSQQYTTAVLSLQGTTTRGPRPWQGTAASIIFAGATLMCLLIILPQLYLNTGPRYAGVAFFGVLAAISIYFSLGFWKGNRTTANISIVWQFILILIDCVLMNPVALVINIFLLYVSFNCRDHPYYKVNPDSLGSSLNESQKLF